MASELERAGGRTIVGDLGKGNRKDTKVIKVDWNDERSIREAEKSKARLENMGYSLVNTRGGLSTSELVYVLKG